MPEYLLTLIRSLLSFVILLVLTRFMGKKQISQLTLFHYIVGITIGSIAASMAVEQSVKMTNAIVGLLVWGGLPILLSILGMKSYLFRRLVDGHPTVLIRDGKVLEDNLRKAKMNTSDLMLELRVKSAFNLADVEFAVMETNGHVTVMKKSDSQPLTPRSFGIQVKPEADPRLVILDGNIMEKTLRKLGYTKQWLLDELRKLGIYNAQDVFLAQIDSKGKVYADLYKDNLDKPKMRQQLASLTTSLNNAHSDLERFALQIRDPDIQQTYARQAKNLKQSIAQLEQQLNKLK